MNVFLPLAQCITRDDGEAGARVVASEADGTGTNVAGADSSV